MEQLVLSSENGYAELNGYLADNNICNIFLVCDSAFGFLKIKDYFDGLEEDGIEITRFDDFQANPLYESVVEGVRLVKESGAKIIIAVGGGSAMDVAKCIKLYSNMDPSKNYLEQEIVPNDVILLAVPTTAGTGSEATRYAVIYYEGKKQSVADYSIIPSVVLFDESALETLPLYQKKVDSIIADWGDVLIINGTYGPYVKGPGRRNNAKIPKDVDPKKISEAEARKMLEEKPKTTRRGARGKRKNTRAKRTKNK